MKETMKAAMLGAAMEMAAANTAEAKEPPRIEESGMHETGDEYTQDFLKKIESGELIVGMDSTPPEVVKVGNQNEVEAVLRAQNLSLTNVGITSAAGEQHSNTWAIVIKDRAGKVVGETQSVQLSVSGPELKVTMLNTDGSLDKIVYSEGKVVSAKHYTLD